MPPCFGCTSCSGSDDDDDDERNKVLNQIDLKVLQDTEFGDAMTGFMAVEGENLDDASSLPRRFLPPGGPSQLFRLYRGTQQALGRPAASWWTFFTTWCKSGFKDALGFRGKAVHARCDECEDYAKYLRDAKTRSASLYPPHGKHI